LAGKTVAIAVSNYGASVKPKLANIAIQGAPEDQLRGPLDSLIQDLAEAGGLPVGSVRLVGETGLADLKTRPDFAVTVGNALIGFIEVKAPGKGADPRQFDDPHDKEQWNKLKSLPNLVYTDGNAFSLWRDGKLAGTARYDFRSFDRQWIIPDARLINQPNPTLWNAHSPRQVHLTALERVSPSSGPAVTFTGLIPDLDHYHGRGGRVHPLWRDKTAKQANIKPALLTHLAEIYGKSNTAEDVMAYLAAVMAHPDFTARFQADLVRPGLHVPLTADVTLFDEAVELGREVIWLHCYGERFADPSANRPKRAPRLPKANAPGIPTGGAIPSAPNPLPDTMEYDPAIDGFALEKVVSRTSRRRSGRMRFRVNRSSGIGSAIGAVIAAAPLSAINGRLPRSTPFSRRVGWPITRAT
jgi:hypothetical protein